MSDHDDDVYTAEEAAAPAGVSLRALELEATKDEGGPGDDEHDEHDDRPADTPAARWNPAVPVEPDDGPDKSIPAAVESFLLATEHTIIATRRHPVRLALPAAVLVGGLVVACALNGYLYYNREATPAAVQPIWIIWTFGALWSLVSYARWRQIWFVVTKQRLLTTGGLIGRRVNMLPIDKLRDVTYDQSGPGRLFGYATLHCDSIATDNALHTIPYVPYPDYYYREISALILPTTDKLSPGRPRRGRGITRT